MTAVALRAGVEIGNPLELVLEFASTYPTYDAGVASGPASFGEADLRLANRGGARISAAEIAAILARRRTIERALRAIAPAASLAAETDAVPWAALTELFDAFAHIHGVGLAKMTKALHPKRPGLIPLLDSVVVAYLASDGPLPESFGERAIALVRRFKQDLDRNRSALDGLRREAAGRGYELSEVRLLDMVIWSAFA